MHLFKSKELIEKTLKNDKSMIEINGNLLKKLHKVELEMLNDIKKICDSAGITIFLSGGTLLGAVRHKGFIPWDDDIDLNIARKDVKDLVNLINKEYSKKYTAYFGENQVCPFIRIEMNGTIFDEPINLTRNRGIKADIFIIEDLPNNAIIRLIFGVICTIKLYIASSLVIYENKDERFINILKSSTESKINYYIRKTIGFLFSNKSYLERIKENDKYFSKYINSNSNYVSIMNGRKHYFGEIYPRNMFQKVIEIEFEKNIFYAQQDYNSYLSQLYGKDYMKLPPENKREHHFVYNIKFNNQKI